MTTAVDALSRLDDTTLLSGDAALLAAFEQHCQAGAPVFCLICGTEGQGIECDACYATHDQAVERSGDL